jgi:hypothetical protein
MVRKIAMCTSLVLSMFADLTCVSWLLQSEEEAGLSGVIAVMFLGM